MGIWILAFGLTTYIGAPFTGPLGLPRISTVFGLSPFVYIGVVLIIVAWFVLAKTSLGLRIRSVGENPSVAEVSGVSVTRTRYLCVVVAGMLMGLAGAIYALFYNPVWNYNFLMGWGFIALALVFFSMWNPLILLGGSLLFGVMWQLSLNPQLVLARHPVQVHLADGSLCHDHHGSVDHLDKVVQDAVGRGETRSARQTVCKGMNSTLDRNYW